MTQAKSLTLLIIPTLFVLMGFLFLVWSTVSLKQRKHHEWNDTKSVISPDDLGIYEQSQWLSIIMIIFKVFGKVSYVKAMCWETMCTASKLSSHKMHLCQSVRTLNKEQHDERGGGGPPTPARRAGTRGQKPQGLLGNAQCLLFHFHWQVRLRYRFPLQPPLPPRPPP